MWDEKSNQSVRKKKLNQPMSYRKVNVDVQPQFLVNVILKELEKSL